MWWDSESINSIYEPTKSTVSIHLKKEKSRFMKEKTDYSTCVPNGNNSENGFEGESFSKNKFQRDNSSCNCKFAEPLFVDTLNSNGIEEEEMTRESAVFEDEMPSSPFVKTPTMRSRAYRYVLFFLLICYISGQKYQAGRI